MQRFLAEIGESQGLAARVSAHAQASGENGLGRGCRKGMQGETRVGERRSQAGIIFISDFVMKIKLHENV
jgi:hypothetical protein